MSKIFFSAMIIDEDCTQYACNFRKIYLRLSIYLIYIHALCLDGFDLLLIPICVYVSILGLSYIFYLRSSLCLSQHMSRGTRLLKVRGNMMVFYKYTAEVECSVLCRVIIPFEVHIGKIRHLECPRAPLFKGVSCSMVILK